MAEPKKIIEPRTLKGFRDFLPETMIPREKMIARVSEVYRRYGYSPIDTPVLEYLEILSGKGSDETDRQLYTRRNWSCRSSGTTSPKSGAARTPRRAGTANFRSAIST